jgi:hypothetical protein
MLIIELLLNGELFMFDKMININGWQIFGLAFAILGSFLTNLYLYSIICTKLNSLLMS